MVKIINVDGVSVSRNGNIVLNNISFSVDKGEFIMVVGSNGSGKSTLLNVIAGVLDYYGYVIVNGYSVNKDNIKSIRRDVSIVINDMDNELIISWEKGKNEVERLSGEEKFVLFSNGQRIFDTEMTWQKG